MGKFTRRLKQLMRDEKKSALDIANLLGQSRAQIYKWLKGSFPQQENFWPSAFRLGIPFDEAVDMFKSEGEPKGWRISFDTAIAAGYDVPADLMPEASTPAPRVASLEAPLARPIAAPFPPIAPTARPFPILGYAAGSLDGRLIMDEGAIEFERCPAELERVESAYGVIVDGDSMKDRYLNGMRLSVNPERSYRPGNGVVVQVEDAGRRYAFVKEFVKQTATHLILRQTNPEQELHFKLSDVRAIHRVVGTYEKD